MNKVWGKKLKIGDKLIISEDQITENLEFQANKLSHYSMAQCKSFLYFQQLKEKISIVLQEDEAHEITLNRSQNYGGDW